jgi:hypothetical protein
MIAIELVSVAQRESREATSRIRCGFNNRPFKIAETALGRARGHRLFCQSGVWTAWAVFNQYSY